MPNSFNTWPPSRSRTRLTATIASGPSPTTGSTSTACRSRSKILLENLLRNEDDVTVTKDDILGTGRVGPQGDPQPRDCFPAQPESCSRTSPASRRWSTSRRCETPWNGWAEIPRRSIRSSRSELVIGDHSGPDLDEAGDFTGLRDQRRTRVQPQRRAVRLPPLGPGRLQELPGRPPRHRDRPPGEPRISRPGGLLLVPTTREGIRRRRAPGLSPHPWSARTRTPR